MSKKNTDYTVYSLPSEQNQVEEEVQEVNEVKEEAAVEAPVVQSQPTLTENKGQVVNCVRLNVRETPTANGRVIDILNRGEIVTIISSDVGWYKIRTAKKTGYVMAQYIEAK